MNFIPKIILIGCGPHSKRVYIPSIQKIKNVVLKLVVDLKVKESEVLNTVKTLSGTECLFVEQFSGELPKELAKKLSKFVVENNITGVIIATEPLVHKQYALWALENNLNILLDKPISSRINVSNNFDEANGLIIDYNDLLEKYESIQNVNETIFMINSHRRFHKGFDFVKSKIREVSAKTNCPVTFISAYHSDGQWRLPTEIVNQEYHPYCFGYGKCSHSGYHIFDIVHQLYEASQLQDKLANNMEIMSSFVTPMGFIEQLVKDDYYKIFGNDYEEVNKFTDSELSEIYKSYGEVDTSAIIRMKRNDVCIANFSINLLHNGFAGRTWINPGEDLYKGNGRIKHESYNIQQGPFQNIQIHAYQSEDKYDSTNLIQSQLGDVNHFDVYVFRNPLVAQNKKRLQVYSYDDILGNIETLEEKIVMEDVKYGVVEDFVGYLCKEKSKYDIKSQIFEHLVPVQFMSGIYKAQILGQSISSIYGKNQQ